MRLHVKTRHESDHSVVAVAGELDHYSAPRLRDELLPLPGGDRPRVILDLAEVTFMDSAGLGLLVEAYKESHQLDGSFALTGVGAPVRRLLQVTGLDTVFRTYDRLDEAIANTRTVA